MAKLLHQESGYTTGPWIDATPYVHLKDAISDAGTNEEMILISCEIDLGVPSLTVPPNVTLRYLQGGTINVASRETLRINGPVRARRHQILVKHSSSATFGTNALDAARVPEVFPEWWSGIPDVVDVCFSR